MLISLVALWAMVIFTMAAVSSIAPGGISQILLIGSALCICLFATASLVAVFSHVRRNRDSVYRQDILISMDQK